MRWIALMLALGMSVIATTQGVLAQQLITTCGSAIGKEYNLETNQWSDNIGVSNQTTAVVRDSNGEYDINYRDVLTSGSVRADGAKVFKVNGSDDERFTLVAVYPQRVIDVYQFTLNANGQGGLIWSSFKNRAGALTPVILGTLLVARCTK